MSSTKELGLFTERRRCVECGRFCLVKMDGERFLESACCNAIMTFGEAQKK